MPTTTTTSLAADVALPEAIRARRTSIGLTQIALARAAGLSITHVANIEQGAIPKRGDAVARILGALDAAEREA